jgi:hypothetical protein
MATVNSSRKENQARTGIKRGIKRQIQVVHGIQAEAEYRHAEKVSECA